MWLAMASERNRKILASSYTLDDTLQMRESGQTKSESAHSNDPAWDWDIKEDINWISHLNTACI